MKDALVPFESISYTKRFLTNCYEQQSFPNAKTLSYHTSYSFIYHLQQGRLYFKQAAQSPIEIQPMLLFYGIVQMLKACVLTADPFYPENSAILAHGVTTRKRKKQGYRFLDDEIKIQKNGLFLHSLSKMFHVKQMPSEKYKMNALMKQIADMHSLYSTMQNQKISLPVTYRYQSFSIASDLLDDLHMTANRFGLFLEQQNQNNWFNRQMGIQSNNHSITIPLHFKPTSYQSPPWLTAIDGKHYILRKREDFCPLPELSIHYLLLYNLSMICRYEAEWWGELHHNFEGEDLPFIKQFLSISNMKLPMLFEHYLCSLE
ncbi:YaaC family protein [Alkalicoccobacillus plakortidis]|uniref:YaaC family protein n=1 Tax=Alkalicoccobacillus plakortidis TaxID=444060 RepID=A0ABT0XKN1_9BACI|nr:YaaC family protein [Alkalicoccobacillus plakortidis]MCM2676464.1 YaaC family protein [Alkalicoccobacillus plakortidis]